MKTHVTPDTSCPSCGHKLDRATSPFGEGEPKPGDLSVCLKCTEILVFGADLTMKAATLDDLLELPAETATELLKLQVAIRVHRPLG